MRTESFAGDGRSGSGPALDKQAVLLLAVQGLIAIATALSGTFLPIYLWKASQSLALIGWFHSTLYTVSGLTFWIAGKWVKEHNKMNSLRLGIVLSGVFYFVILLLGTRAVTYAIPLGVLGGLGQGFFWLAYNVVYFEITEPANRDRFNGWTGLIASGAGIVVPWISGFIITASTGNQGYSIIYTASAIIFGIATILSFWLKKREAAGRYEWLYGFRQLKTPGDPWRRVALAIVAQGIRDGVFMFLVGLLVFMATRNEQKLGSFSLITSLLALISFWLIGR
ncbi:MFS transporter, partial [Paenibacillus sepulcri]|nr:MFS transporter [Paenibacillus sepulcri]